MKGALIVAALAAASLLSGCNTVAGFGEDITGAARAVQGGLPGSGGYQ